MIISWNTTNACNLNCAHCYRDSGQLAAGELTTDEAKGLIDGIARARFRIMIFSGGEPLLRSDLDELISYATGKKLVAVLGTNGIFLTEKRARELKAAGLKAAGISLDSLDAQKHDELRGVEGAWQGAADALAACRAANLSFQIHTTVFRWNMGELSDITDFAVAQGAKAHHLFFLIPTGRGENIAAAMPSPAEHEEVLKAIMEKQRSIGGAFELKPTCAPQFVRIARELGVKTRFSRGCLAGLSYAIVSPQGRVQPCAYLPHYLGDVRETPFDVIWRDNAVLKKLRTQEYGGSCGLCPDRNNCGGCRARAAAYADGDFMAEDIWCEWARGQ